MDLPGLGLSLLLVDHTKTTLTPQIPLIEKYLDLIWWDNGLFVIFGSLLAYLGTGMFEIGL